MSNDQLRNDILAYADGELAPDRAAELERAMAEDPQIRQEVEQWRQLRSAAKRVLFADAAPQEMQRRIAAQLDAIKPQRAALPKIFRLTQPYMAAAAAVVIALGLYFFGPAAQNPAIADPAQFPNRHMICLNSDDHADTLHVNGTSPGETQTMLTQKYDYPVMVPDLSAIGWELRAGRECGIYCNSSNQQADKGKPIRMVHVFYMSKDDPNQSISLFSVERRVNFPKTCAKVAGCGGSRTYLETQACSQTGGFVTVSWDEPKNTYAACGKLSGSELRGLLDEVHLAMNEQRTLLLAVSK
jgi:anti-sigma factor RsiW